MGGEFLSFDEALAELQMATHELRSLVAQGEIRAFREEDVLKFRRTDVLDLKKSREVQPGELTIEPEDIGDGAPTLSEEEVRARAEEGPAPGEEITPPEDDETGETELLTGIGEPESTDFLGLDDTTAGEEGGDTAQTVVPTIEVSDEDVVDDTAQTVVPTLSGEDETNILEETQEAEGPSLLSEEDEATEMATQEIEPGEMASAATQPVGVEEEEEEEEAAPLRFQDAEEATAAGVEVSTEDVEGAGVTTRSRFARARAEAAPAISPLFFVITILTFLVLLFGVPVFYGLAHDRVPQFQPYKSIVQFLEQKTIK